MSRSLYELFKFKIAIELCFNIHLVPRNLCKCYTEKALCVQSVSAVYERYIATALGRDSGKFENIGCCYKLNLIKILAVANHIIPSNLEYQVVYEKRRFPLDAIIILIFSDVSIGFRKVLPIALLNKLCGIFYIDFAQMK